MTVRILRGDCRDVLRTLPDESVHCVVTSPPYWGLRDYGVRPSIWGGDDACEHEWGDEIAVNATNHTDKARWNHTRNGRDELQPVEKRVSWLRTQVKQGHFCQRCGAWAGAHGLEPRYDLYVQNEVAVFREVRRVLRADGTLWLNLGDSYCNTDKWGGGVGGNTGKHSVADDGSVPSWSVRTRKESQRGVKPKDLMGMPWRVAFALQADGWWLRQDIIWSKPNPMPESVTDRCTKAHEYLFLLSKSERYAFDQDAILEPISAASVDRLSQPTIDDQHGCERGVPTGITGTTSGAVAGSVPWEGSMRNRRTVWTVMTQPFSEAHFATFPPALIEPCIRAGCPKGGTVLDPFGGAGTTGLVADRLGRDAILIELNPAYADMAERRLTQEAGMFAKVVNQ